MQDTVKDSTDQMYNRATNTIDVDKTKLNTETEVFAIFGDHATEADRLNAKMTGAIIPDYDVGFESDTSSEDEDEPKPKSTFDLGLLFQLTPNLADAGGMDDHNSIETNTTGVTNATQQILEEAISTRFDSIELDDSTVTSALTNHTLYTPPQKPKELNVNLENEHDFMSQEGQKKGEDKMDVEIYGKKNGNQKEELEENSESYPFEKTTNSNSPDRDAIMAVEGSSNKHEEEDRQNNGKDDDIDDQSEGSEKGRDDKEE